MITTTDKLDAQPETRCAGRHKNVDCARLSRYPALSTSWVRLRLEFVVDADRAVMVGNNGNSDIEMHSGHHGGRAAFDLRLRKDGHQRFSVNAGLGKGRKTRDGIATKHGRR